MYQSCFPTYYSYWNRPLFLVFKLIVQCFVIFIYKMGLKIVFRIVSKS